MRKQHTALLKKQPRFFRISSLAMNDATPLKRENVKGLYLGNNVSAICVTYKTVKPSYRSVHVLCKIFYISNIFLTNNYW